MYASPVATFGITSPLCEKNRISFSDQSIAFGQPLQKWNWNFGDGVTESINTPTHVFLKADSLKVSLSVENDKGCRSNLIQKDIQINPLPHPVFFMPAICLADPFATFINSPVIGDCSEAQFLYAWNFGDVNASPPNPNSFALQSPQHSYSNVGIYPVQLTVTSKNGCIKDSIKNFTVNGSQPVAIFTIDPAVNFCSNTHVTIINSATVNFGSISKVEIYWDFVNAPSIKITDSLPFSGKKYSHRYTEFGSPLTKEMQVRYMVYSGISCVDETTKKIIIKASPVIQFAPLSSICAGATPFLLSSLTEINALTGMGIYSGAGVNTVGVFDPKAATPGSHIIRYSFLAANNCMAFAEQPINVFEQPVVNAGPDRTMLKGGFIILNATAAGTGLQYQWTPKTAIENNLVVTPKVSPMLTITYTLKVISADGCSAKDEVMVTVLKDIFIPSAFSPNGDGINDKWSIPFIDSYSGASVQVFKKYGQKVFQSTEKSVSWDGKFNGKLLPVASYVWVLNPGSGRKLMYGSIMIVQ